MAPGGTRQVQLGAAGGALAGLLAAPRARIEVPPVFVDVREDHVGVVFERVEHAVAVVRIDVDVGDSFQTITFAQQLDGHAAIVEHAEARGLVARGVVEAGNRHETVAGRTAHDGVRRIERGADDGRGRLEHAPKRGRVALIQHALAGDGAFPHQIHVAGRERKAALRRWRGGARA